ncbi:EamA family transporter [Cytobacillus gottheilii]|uniref:DMT family transporter n=1 Tax=Cytobacillus gottheilii TaxID=859144 RepID=A0ABX8FFC9_9BACI|nr:DMT family transporter [Cytobacillus gottheilii]QVY62695.1 DMT family transporter [Cytobacillus gottheilii]
MKSWHYALLVFLGGCSFGILSTFVKLAYAAGFTMPQVSGSQVFFGTVIIWSIALFAKKIKITMLQAGKILGAGIPTGLTGVFYYQCLQTVNASLAIIFLFQFIWIGTLIEWIVYKRKPSKLKVISIIILLAGSLLAAGLISGNIQSISGEGAMWGLLSAVTFSLFIFLSGVVGKELPAIQKSALLATGSMITVFILFPPLFIFDPPVLFSLAPYGLLLGIFGVVLPPLLFSIGMPHVGPGLGTILTASELPVAVVLSAAVLSEHVGFLQWTGVLIILAGIMIGNKSSIQPKIIQPYELNSQG